MAASAKDLKLFRIAMSAIGAGLLFRAVWIASTGEAVIHGRRHTSIYHGQEALLWAGLFACFGVALFGAWSRKGSIAGMWIGVWFIAGTGLVLLPAYS